MVCALKAKGVFGITSGAEILPEEAEGNADRRARWYKSDAVAMFTLMTAMEVSQITLVESCESSKEILDKLDSVSAKIGI